VRLGTAKFKDGKVPNFLESPSNGHLRDGVAGVEVIHKACTVRDLKWQRTTNVRTERKGLFGTVATDY
jgi:hypothetical protein